MKVCGKRPASTTTGKCDFHINFLIEQLELESQKTKSSPTDPKLESETIELKKK